MEWEEEGEDEMYNNDDDDDIDRDGMYFDDRPTLAERIKTKQL